MSGGHLAAVKAAFGGIAVLVGLVSGLQGLWTSSWLTAINTLGLIGGIGPIIFSVSAFIVSGAADATLEERFQASAIASLTAALISTLLFFVFGNALSKEEAGEGSILTVFGVISIVLLIFSVVYATRFLEARSAPATKTCPDCANTVLQAARKWEGAASAGPRSPRGARS